MRRRQASAGPGRGFVGLSSKDEEEVLLLSHSQFLYPKWLGFRDGPILRSCFILPRGCCHLYHLNAVCFLSYLTHMEIALVLVSF